LGSSAKDLAFVMSSFQPGSSAYIVLHLARSYTVAGILPFSFLPSSS